MVDVSMNFAWNETRLRQVRDHISFDDWSGGVSAVFGFDASGLFACPSVESADACHHVSLACGQEASGPRVYRPRRRSSMALVILLLPIVAFGLPQFAARAGFTAQDVVQLRLCGFLGDNVAVQTLARLHSVNI
jgi:hypothetical protein